MILVLTYTVLASSLCLAADTPTSKTLAVTANVGQELELTGWIKEMSAGQTDPGVQGTLKDFPSELAFGTLTSILSNQQDAGCLYSQKWYAVFLVAKTSGRRYRIQSEGTSIEGYGNASGYDLPDTAFVLTPGYEPLDKWTWPGGEEAQGDDTNPGGDPGDQSSAVGLHTVYDSGTGGDSRIVRAFYSIPCYPGSTDPDLYSGWAPVPKDQHFGPYSGSVTITLILK
jgi:hypothetical protein